jgi:hypothetical protein
MNKSTEISQMAQQIHLISISYSGPLQAKFQVNQDLFNLNDSIHDTYAFFPTVASQDLLAVGYIITKQLQSCSMQVCICFAIYLII